MYKTEFLMIQVIFEATIIFLFDTLRMPPSNTSTLIEKQNIMILGFNMQTIINTSLYPICTMI